MSLVRLGRGSLRKQPTFHDTNTGFPAKWHLRNERRNSILMARHYPDLGRASDWLKQISHVARPIRSTTQNWIVTRHQYGISALISQTSFGGETSDGVVKCGLLFFHTTKLKTIFDCGLEAVDSGFQDWIPDSVIVEKGFRILFITGIPDFLSCIPESTSQNLPDSRIRITLPWRPSIELHCNGRIKNRGNEWSTTNRSTKSRVVSSRVWCNCDGPIAAHIAFTTL